MKIKRFFAPDTRKALRQVQKELGPDAIIISNRQVDDGVEVIAAIDYASELLEHGELDTAQATRMPDSHVPADPAPEAPAAEAAPATPAAPEAAPQAAPAAETPAEPAAAAAADGKPLPLPEDRDLVFERFMKSAKAAPQTPAGSAAQATDQPAAAQTAAAPGATQPAGPAGPNPTAGATAGQAASGSDNAEAVIRNMRAEINKLRGLMESQFTSLHAGQWSQNSPIRSNLLRQLTRLGLSPQYAGQLIASLGDVESRTPQLATRDALARLTEEIKVTGDDILRQGGSVVLLGPAGAGKTTTIAKLANRYAKLHDRSDVILVSTDNHRVGAHEQLLAYSRLLNIPVLRARDDAELEQILIATADKGLVLVDCGSLTQQDLRQPERLPSLRIQAPRPLRHYLVLPATYQIPTQERVLSSLASHLAGCIVSKVDEAANLGGALTATIRTGVPIAYWADGPKVTAHLHPAEPRHLLAKAVAMVRNQDFVPDEDPAGARPEAGRPLTQ